MPDRIGDIPVLEPRPPARVDVGLARAVDNALAVLGDIGEHGLTVAVNDPQRDTRSADVLGELFQRVDPKRCRLVLATGTHRFDESVTGPFLADLLRGTKLAAVDVHDARSPELKPTSGGNTWTGHPWLSGPGGKLGIGSVEPHYFAGYTGAHKTLTIGLASYREIEDNHAHALSPLAQPGSLMSNPVFQGISGMLRSLHASGPVAAVNLVQAGSRIVGAFGGGAMSALADAIELAAATFACEIETPAAALILEVTGALGRSFYQADKGIKNSEHAVRDGGVIVLCAPCPEGVGQDHFVSLLRQADSYRKARDVVTGRGYRLGDHKAVRLRRLTDPRERNVRVFLVSKGISAGDARLLGMTKADSADAALRAAGINIDAPGVYRVRDAGNVAVVAGPISDDSSAAIDTNQPWQ